jgi:hypothetical protein
MNFYENKVISLLAASEIALAIGFLLFPMGIVYFSDEWKDLKKFPWWQKILAIILEVAEAVISPTTGAISVLLLSIILILVGGTLLLANFHLINVQKL